MLLPTTYLTVFLAVISWGNLLPSGFQIPQFSIPTPPQIQMPTAQQPTMTVPTTQPTATPKPTLTPTYIIRPTATPFPKPTATPTPKPTVTQSTSSSLLDSKQQYMLDQINEYRASNSLSPVKADKMTCDFAKIRSQEIVNDFSHSGFQSRANSHTLPYSSYHAVTENIAMTSDYKQVVTMWKNSSGHAANMRADTPYVCVAYTGNYYAYEGWRP